MNDINIISIDFAINGDRSAIVSSCYKCRTLLDVQTYIGNELNIKIFIKCPNCGIKFKQHKIVEEH